MIVVVVVVSPESMIYNILFEIIAVFRVTRYLIFGLVTYVLTFEVVFHVLCIV